MVDNSPVDGIWEKIRTGDESALAALYDQYYIRLMNFGLKYTLDKELINQCISNILLHFWTKRRQLPPVTRLTGYLQTFLKRELFKEMKNREMRTHAIEFFPAEQEAPSYEYILGQLEEDRELWEALTACIKNHLSTRQAELIRLRFFEDLSYEEIAQRCGITKRTAYNLVFNALSTIRKVMYKDGKNLAFHHIPLLLIAMYRR